jgi:hypothetical protein
MNLNAKLQAIYEPAFQRVGIYGVVDGAKIMPVTIQEKEKFETIEPFLTFDDKSDLQGLIDDLWMMGLRPSSRSDEYKAQLETMENHLNDMRCLVFSKQVNKPSKKF